MVVTHPGKLVERQVHQILAAGDAPAIHLDDLAVGIDSRAIPAHDLPVDLDPSLADQLLALPAAADTRRRPAPCKRTPPGTSVSESCPGSSVRSMPCAPSRRRAVTRRRARQGAPHRLLASATAIAVVMGSMRSSPASSASRGSRGSPVPQRRRRPGRPAGSTAPPESESHPASSTAWVRRHRRSAARAGAPQCPRRLPRRPSASLDVHRAGRARGRAGPPGWPGPAVPGSIRSCGRGWRRFLVFGARLLDQAAQRQRAHHPVAVDTRVPPRPRARLTGCR